ncbi:MAG: hypothetical protein J5I93_13355 [Pirellulaceae bacterium]|nr:hypothetical protein [Pirellulaceae bacterium]
MSEKNVQKFKRRIRELTGRSRGISMERRMSELRTYIRGWMGYFRLAAQRKLFDKLDRWLRRRLRMCYWKRWRFVRTRRRELIRLGAARRRAIRHARSRKGPSHMAKSIATGVGLTNAWLQEQGLLSLKTLWAPRAPLRRTAWCGPACQVVWGPGGETRPATRFCGIFQPSFVYVFETALSDFRH